MIAIGLLFVRMLCDCFKSRRRLEAEIWHCGISSMSLQQRAPHSMPGRNGILAAREAKRADDTML
jgi:hypothetical protein